ncbi:MAG: hypothetical protein Q9166_001055 [cf. Caloplaca sp. 2 TL-2023]
MGFRIYDIVRQVGKPTLATSTYTINEISKHGHENWLRARFEVLCLDIKERSSSQSSRDAASFHHFMQTTPVRLSSNHEDFAWFTKDEIQLMMEGRSAQRLVDVVTGRLSLRAFKMREQSHWGDEVKALPSDYMSKVSWDLIRQKRLAETLEAGVPRARDDG